MSIDREEVLCVVLIILGLLLLIYPQIFAYVIGIILVALGVLMLFNSSN